METLAIPVRPVHISWSNQVPVVAGMRFGPLPPLQRLYGARLNHFLGSFGLETNCATNAHILNLTTPYLLANGRWLQADGIGELLNGHQSPLQYAHSYFSSLISPLLCVHNHVAKNYWCTQRHLPCFKDNNSAINNIVSTESTPKRKSFGQRIAEWPLPEAPGWVRSLPILKAQPGKGQLLPRMWGLVPWYLEIEAVVDALNGKKLWSLLASEGPGSTRHGDYDQKLRETPPILRKIVHAWWKSGPNLRKFRLVNPKMSADADSFCSRIPVELYWGDSGNANFLHTLLDEPRSTPYEEAIRFFLLLITNPYANKLAGPCARCGNYYLKKRVSQKVYCSRRCGNARTATVRTREQRIQNHADKLRRSRAAIRKWMRTRTGLDWKQYVCKQESDITPKFLTRAVNRGELKPPVRH